jgi:hypothetical protein
MRTLCVRSFASKDYPFSSHLAPERLPREMPAAGHGDRCNDDPQRGGQYEVRGHEGYL